MKFKMNKKENVYPEKLQRSGGFAMIFTVLIMSLILTITLGMSNIVFKQRILSGLVRDSQIAFYQADSGSECGLFYDYKKSLFIKDQPIIEDASNPKYNYEFTCGDTTMRYNDLESKKTANTNYFVFQQISPNPNRPCYTIVFDKRDSSPTLVNVIDSRGYNICGANIRQVERAIKISY